MKTTLSSKKPRYELTCVYAKDHVIFSKIFFDKQQVRRYRDGMHVGEDVHFEVKMLPAVEAHTK